jgi:hypothetical protein
MDFRASSPVILLRSPALSSMPCRSRCVPLASKRRFCWTLNDRFYASFPYPHLHSCNRLFGIYRLMYYRAISAFRATFLATRGCIRPTGEPLYSYRVAKDEFLSLQSGLRTFVFEESKLYKDLEKTGYAPWMDLENKPSRGRSLPREVMQRASFQC